ncbi:hypothetical protein FRC17_001114 [Serendipita sp. 399]|nr:hypothetical protein FRC17_001114 [Serendipita sp. 399]
MDHVYRDFVHALWAYRISTSITYAAFAVLIWDIVITFAQEVAFVWPAKFTIVKGLFLFNRYISPTVVAVNLWMFSGHATHLNDKALKIPRSSQTPLLAILYKQGILYFAVTFILFFTSLSIWRFLPKEWFYLPLLSTWILCQIAMSRLLLSVKSSQAFQEKLRIRSESPNPHSAITRALSPGLLPPAFPATALNCATKLDSSRRNSRILVGRPSGDRQCNAIPLTSMMRSGVGASGGQQHERNDSSSHDESNMHKDQIIYKPAEGGGDIMTAITDKSGTTTTTLPPFQVHTAPRASNESEENGGFAGRILHVISSALPWWFARRSYGDLHIEVMAEDDGDDEGEDGVEDGGRDPSSGLPPVPGPVDALAAEEGSVGASTAPQTDDRDRGRGRGRGGVRVSRIGRYDQWL